MSKSVFRFRIYQANEQHPGTPKHSHLWMSNIMASGIDTEAANGEENREQEDLGISRLSAGKSIMQSKLADEAQLRRFTEEVLDSRQQEIESREDEKHQLAIELSFLKKELIDAQWQLAEARNLNKSKMKLLQEAQDQIFRLQPRRKDITEAEAQQAYRCLCSNVERWVNHRLKAILDLDIPQLAARPISTQATRLVQLIRSPAKRYLDVDQTDEHHIISAIMNYLYLFIFSKSFYCPLDDNTSDRTLKWVNELETAMSRLPRGINSPSRVFFKANCSDRPCSLSRMEERDTHGTNKPTEFQKSAHEACSSNCRKPYIAP